MLSVMATRCPSAKALMIGLLTTRSEKSQARTGVKEIVRGHGAGLAIRAGRLSSLHLSLQLSLHI